MFSIGSASAALNLNASLQLMMNIKAASNFNGQVALSVDRASVGAIDKGQDISISVSPSSVNLAAGSSAVLTVMISSKSTAPDLSAVPFKIVATEMNPVGAAASSSVSVPLTVNPMIVIKFLGHPVAGQATEKFTGETDSTDIAKSTLSLRGHKNGVTVRFLNMDTAGVHRVHGNNAIVHEGAGGFAGEKVKNQYDVPVMAQVATTGQFYCHDDSDTADTVTMNFNAMPAE